MDLLAKFIVLIGTPLLLYISQLSHQFLLTTLLIFSPFTIILSIEAFHYFSTPRALKYLVLNIETNSGLNHDPPEKPIDSDKASAHQQSRKSHYRLWLISAHLTYLAVFEYYLVGSLQLSISESSSLLLSYMILLLALIDLKQYNGQHGKQSRRRITRTLCNLIHLAILAQLAYLNLTFGCAPRLSSLLGTKILLPSDCSYARDNQVARIAIFCGINAAQILFCQLAFLLMSYLNSESGGAHNLLHVERGAPVQISQ